MRKRIVLILLGGICLLFMNFRVIAQTQSTTLELSVRQVVVEDGVASITGPAANIKVELYDNLGEELIASGTSDANGQVTFPLDDKYPLSGKGLFHTVVKVDGISNGEFTCQQGQTCQETVFLADGLSSDKEDGILIVKVVRSGNPFERVGGIKVYVWPTDGSGNPIPANSIRLDTNMNNRIYYQGVPCVTNQEGYCAAVLRNYFIWVKDAAGEAVTQAVINFGNEYVYDLTTIKVPEGGLIQVTIPVDEKGMLDDCVSKIPPTDLELSSSCMDKLHQTATAQVQSPADPIAIANMNRAIVQASQLSRNTADLFAVIIPDLIKINELIAGSNSSHDPLTQIKIILNVNNITNYGIRTKVGDFALGKEVAIYKQDDSAQLLGACEVNGLGECVIILSRTDVLDFDNLIKFRVMADGYDNGILVCKDQPICEQRAYTVTGLIGENDAILLIKIVQEEDLTKPVQHLPSSVHSKIETREWDILYHEYHYTDKFGTRPIYISGGNSWINEGGKNFEFINVYIGSSFGNDTFHLKIIDGQLNTYYFAVDKTGKFADCVFTSPFTYNPVLFISSDCSAKKKSLQTAIAGYTATPTVTITLLPSSTPTATKVPPTPTATLIPSPTPLEGVGNDFGNSRGLFVAGGILIVLMIAGLGVYLWKRKNH
jgi:hypothetical protein